MSKAAAERSEENQEEKKASQQQEKSIQLDMDEQIADGVYSNMVISNFSEEEFVLDFAFLQPQQPKGRVRSRVVLTPKNAKRLCQLLKGNLQEYEKRFGNIADDPKNKGLQFSVN